MSFFKILSDSEFEEIKITGNKKEIHYFKANILPDRNFVYDMIHNYSEYWDEIHEFEYLKIRSDL